VRDAADRATATLPAKTSPTVGDSSRRDERAIAWASIAAARDNPSNVAATLSTRDGPAFVSLGAADLATLLAIGLPTQLPKSATSLQVAIDEDQVLLRTMLDAKDIAGDGTIGRLLGIAMSGRDSVRLAGTIEPLRPGFAQFRVRALRIKGVNVPPRMIPTVVRALRRGPRTDGLADDALAVRLPRTVADLRITNGRLILYKATPNP
jgi:hypothetical protein